MIRVLDKSIADKIAAGEVIDRPVSIIKELLENSLDAGADSITVEIRNGGKSYIRVTDNGCGIESDQVEIAFRRHATSKISSEKDLDAIGTLGFRGEALASICAVSRVELITKTRDARTGQKIAVDGSRIVENTATGCPDGTTVTVRDLFYNVPARRKFMGSDSAETRRIVDMVSRISLAYVDVKITLINGNRTVFATRGNGNIYNNIIKIYGSDIGRDLLPVDGRQGDFIIRGFVSPPSESAPSRSKQIFCVNGRVVSSKVLEKGLEDAYREKLFTGRFPVAFLFLSLPPEKLDVNVHPTKKEIRFDDDFEAEDFVRTNVSKALRVKESLPQIRGENLRHQVSTGEEQTAYIYEKEQSAEPYGAVIKSTPDAGVSKPESIDADHVLSGEKPSAVLSTNDFGEKKASTQAAGAITAVTTPAVPVVKVHEQGEQAEIKSLLSEMREERQDEEQRDREMAPKKPDSRGFDFRELHYMGALFNTYIMACDDDDFYLIDQHAAHERVFYEKLLRQYNEREKLSQQLLIPVNMNVSANVTVTEDVWLQDVRSMGYDIEFFGNNTYIVREIPAFMELREAEDFLTDFFKELESKPDLTDRNVLEKIIMRSCRSAVKGGDVLTEAEIEGLIKDLSACVNPFSCPHGRPTFIRMTRYEIEKLFKRV